MLKYLFTAEYKDGSIFQQTPEDVSAVDPSKSCFFDVKHDQLRRFTLKGEGHEYSVDMFDGSFSVDGVKFKFHQDDIRGMPLKLYFFRNHQRHLRVGAEKSEEVGHEIAYLMGWEYDFRFKHYQQIMKID